MLLLKIIGLISEAIAGAYLINYFKYNEENINYQFGTLILTFILWYFTII